MTGAKVFYTILDELESASDLQKANWKSGNNESYENTKEMADVGYGISVIARIEKRWNTIRICYAKTRNTEWRPVNSNHLTLIEFFQKKLTQAPSGKCLSVFFDGIDCQKTIKAVVGLIAAECGINATEDQAEIAIHKINADLAALGLVIGDWTFYPMQKAWNKNKSL